MRWAHESLDCSDSRLSLLCGKSSVASWGPRWSTELLNKAACRLCVKFAFTSFALPVLQRCAVNEAVLLAACDGACLGWSAARGFVAVVLPYVCFEFSQCWGHFCLQQSFAVARGARHPGKHRSRPERKEKQHEGRFEEKQQHAATFLLNRFTGWLCMLLVRCSNPSIGLQNCEKGAGGESFGLGYKLFDSHHCMMFFQEASKPSWNTESSKQAQMQPKCTP